MSPVLSVIALVLANAIPLIGVVVWHWDAASIVIFYWSENLIIGAFTIVKMLVKSPVGGLFSSAFFLVHYGGFCAVHGVFALSIFGFDMDDVLDGIGWPLLLVFVELLIRVVSRVFSVAPPEWLWGFAALAVSHGISLATNYFGRGEHEQQTLRTLMSAPYRRVIVLHIAIIAGGFGTIALGSPLALLVALVIGKTALDLVIHVKEHKLRVGTLWRGIERWLDAAATR